MMYSGGNFFGLFWIFPLLGFSAFLLVLFLRGRSSSSARSHSHQVENRKTGEQRKIPEEIRQAGKDVLDNLDWEIRLLEKQRLDTESSKEREKIEVELKDKKNQYRTVVERLEL